MEKRHNYVRKVAEVAVQLFITNDKPNIAGLVLAGSADFKTELSQSDMFDPVGLYCFMKCFKYIFNNLFGEVFWTLRLTWGFDQNYWVFIFFLCSFWHRLMMYVALTLFQSYGDLEAEDT